MENKICVMGNTSLFILLLWIIKLIQKEKRKQDCNQIIFLIYQSLLSNEAHVSVSRKEIFPGIISCLEHNQINSICGFASENKFDLTPKVDCNFLEGKYESWSLFCKSSIGIFGFLPDSKSPRSYPCVCL